MVCPSALKVKLPELMPGSDEVSERQLTTKSSLEIKYPAARSLRFAVSQNSEPEKGVRDARNVPRGTYSFYLTYWHVNQIINSKVLNIILG
jgi:hypothetical protein